MTYIRNFALALSLLLAINIQAQSGAEASNHDFESLDTATATALIGYTEEVSLFTINSEGQMIELTQPAVVTNEDALKLGQPSLFILSGDTVHSLEKVFISIEDATAVRQNALENRNSKAVPSSFNEKWYKEYNNMH
ncbi:hypothetical protein MRY82_03060 [bacterium]|nr:hypothetical protein [bacterium]